MKASIIIRGFLLISLLIIPVGIGNVSLASSNYQDNVYQQALEEEKRLQKALENAIKSGNRKKIEEARRMIEKHRRVAEQARKEFALKEKLRTERLIQESRMKESMTGARKELALKETAMMKEQMLKERQLSERKMVEEKLKASRMTESKLRMQSVKGQAQMRGKTHTVTGARSSLGGAKEVLSAPDFRSATKRPYTDTGSIALPSAISKSSSKTDRSPPRTQMPRPRTPAPTPTAVQHVPSIKPSPAARKDASRKAPASLYSAPAAFSKRTKDMPPPKAVADIQPSRQTYSPEVSAQHRPSLNADALEARPPGAPKGPNEFSYDGVFKNVANKPQPQQSSSASASSGKVKAPSRAKASVHRDPVDLSKLVKNSKPSSGNSVSGNASGVKIVTGRISTEPILTPQQAGVKMPGRVVTYDPNKSYSQNEKSLRDKAGWHPAEHEASRKVRSFSQIKKTVDDEAYNYNIKRQDLADSKKYPGALEAKARLKKSIGESRQVLERAPQVRKNLYHKIQGDPLAIDKINQGSPETRRSFLKVKEDVVKNTKLNLKNKLAERLHTDPKNIKLETYSFPKKPNDPNVGHDVDVSARVNVNGREVEIPGDLIQEELKGAYRKAVGNPKVNPQDANIHGVSHSSKEGLGFYPGEQKKLGQNPKLPAHDPHGYADQFGAKVEGPAYEGHKFQKKGDMVGAELKRYESQRELGKMGRETIKRVEAHGGEVSAHVKKSLEIVNKAGQPGADGKLPSPQEIEARLRARGETVATLRSKLEANSAGADVLKGPGKGISDKARATAFNENVKDRLAIKRMKAGKQQFDWEKGLKKPSREGLKPGETRTGKKSLTKGLSSSSMKSNWQKGKEIAGRTLGVTMAGGMLASGAQREAENAAKEGRDFSHLKAVGNVGKDVVQGSVISPLKTGMKAAREELKKLPEYEKQVRKDFKKDSAFQRMTKEEQDKFVQNVAKMRAAPVAAGKALKGVFYDPIHDSTHSASKRILEEEALKEFKEAKAAGEGNKLSAWRVAKYKARAAARIAGKAGEVAWEYSGIGPMVDYMMYDSKAERQAADMQRRLQKDTKSKLLDGLTKTTRISEEIEQLTANGDPNDPATQQKLQTLREEYAATLNKVRRVDERMKDKVGHSDPMVAKLQGAVREIAEDPTPWWADEPGTDSGKGNTSEGEKITDPEPLAGKSSGEGKSTPGEGKTTTGASDSATDDLTKKQPSKTNEKLPTEGGDQYVSVSGDELYGGPVSKTKVKVKAKSVGGAELYGGPGSKTTVDDVTQKLIAQINDQQPIESGDQSALGEGKPADSGDNIDALRDAATTYSGDETWITSTNPKLAALPNMLGSFINDQNLQSNDESNKFQGDAARSVEEKVAAIQARDYQGQKQISTGKLSLDYSITKVKLAEESAEAIAEAERNQVAETRDAISNTFTRVIATPFDTGGRILGTGTAKHSAGIKPSHTDGSSSHGTSGSSSGDSKSGTHGTGNSGNTRSSPFQGTISGGWSGSDMSGSFTMHISAGGAVTGSYSGSSSGSLSGNVGSSGNVRAATGSATGEDSATWTGSIRRDSNGRLSGSGSWDSPFASGGWSGGGS